MTTKHRSSRAPRHRGASTIKAKLGRRFEQALSYANRLHARQRRKGTTIPYMAHLLGVASLVLSAGGDEDVAIAALLHDGPEDQGGLPVLRAIERKFGKRVARMVDACTDTYQNPKPGWSERKREYIASIADKADDERLVSIADKVYNARQILEDHQQLGDAVFERFTGKKQGTLWYYRALVEAFRKAGQVVLLDQFDRIVTELECVSLVKAGTACRE